MTQSHCAVIGGIVEVESAAEQAPSGLQRLSHASAWHLGAQQSIHWRDLLGSALSLDLVIHGLKAW